MIIKKVFPNIEKLREKNVFWSFLAQEFLQQIF